jgi:hypothetical protein
MTRPAPLPAVALTGDLQPAHQGTGPLLQRDYWAVISRARARPSAIIDDLGRRFPAFAPPELVVFRRAGVSDADAANDQPLAPGHELDVAITAAGTFRVRVVCCQPQSITLATLKGHPEAGRITFGAYRNAEGAVIFHIRSRARSSDGLRYLGYLLAGEAMQTNTWTDFVKSVALTFGDGVAGSVHAETTVITGAGDVTGDDDDADDGSERLLCSPTFLAEGD